MNPDDFALDDVATDDVAPEKPRSNASLEAALAKHANRAIEQGADPKAVSDLLTSHIRYARGNPVERQNAERALNEGADADAVTSLFFQRVAADTSGETPAVPLSPLERKRRARERANQNAEALAQLDTPMEAVAKNLFQGVETTAGGLPGGKMAMAGLRALGPETFSEAM